MTNTDSKKRRKRITAAVSMVLILALLGGTFAWNNYRQHKTNDAMTEELLYKAVLVEEYDRTKAQNWNPVNPELSKKISVWNPGNSESQSDDRTYGDIFARIQLKEFMEFYPMIQEYTPDRYMIDTDGRFITFYPGTNYRITADEETGWPVVLETDAPAGGAVFEGGEDAAREYARILSLKADNGEHIVARQRVYFTAFRTTSISANRLSISAYLSRYNAIHGTSLTVDDLTVDPAGEILNVNSQYLPAGIVNPETGLDDDELPWYIQTKENDPNGVYGNFVLLDAQVNNENPRNILIDEDENGIADFLQTPIPERANEDQNKDMTGVHDDLHDELIDSAVDVGYTIPQVNGECEYTPHRWADGKNKWEINGQNNPSFFDYIEWVYGENVILLSDWDGKPVKKWIIDDRETGTDDGWVWWGHYLAPGEQTDNFLEKLALIKPSDDKMYYAIHADMQAVSYEELTRWEEANDPSGNDQIVDALRKSKMKINSVAIKEKPIDIMRGTSYGFSAAVQGSIGVNKAVTWSLVGYNGTLSSIDQNGRLTVGAAETVPTLTIRVTSVYDDSKYATWTVNVRWDESVNGATHVIPGEKLDDDSDWMAITEQDGYYLIVRLNSLPVGEVSFKDSGNYDYAASNVKQAIELWYDNTNTGTNAGASTGSLAGLKSFAVKSDADVVVGEYGNITADISTPNAEEGYAYPFALSYQEAARYMCKEWHNGTSLETTGRRQYTLSNWNFFSTYVTSETASWTRSPGIAATDAGWLHHATGGGLGRNPVTVSNYLHPAMWVKAEIFD